MDNRLLLLTARVVSLIFSPFYMPVAAFIVLFAFSYLNNYPPLLKAIILAMVYFFTVLLPVATIFAYRKLNGWTRFHMGKRANRYVPYIISITSYMALLYLMLALHMPRFTIAVVVAALVLQTVCALINNFLKISTHAAASGGVVGALTGFSLLFNFDPTRYLCLAILLCGLVGTSRLILRQHKLAEIGIGTLVGILCGFFCVILI